MCTAIKCLWNNGSHISRKHAHTHGEYENKSTRFYYMWISNCAASTLLSTSYQQQGLGFILNFRTHWNGARITTYSSIYLFECRFCCITWSAEQPIFHINVLPHVHRIFPLRLASICFVNSFDRNVSNHKSNSLNFWTETFCGFIFVCPKYTHKHTFTHTTTEEKDIINTQTIPYHAVPCLWSEKNKQQQQQLAWSGYTLLQ